MNTVAQRLKRIGVSVESADLGEVVPVEPVAAEDSMPSMVETSELHDATTSVTEAESVLTQLQEDHSELEEVSAALESFIASGVEIHPMAIAALGIPSRRATKSYGLTSAIPSVEAIGTGVEANGSALRTALDGNKSRAAQLAKWIKEVFMALIQKAREWWNAHINQFGRLAKAAKELGEKAADLGSARGQIELTAALANSIVVDGSVSMGELVKHADIIKKLAEGSARGLLPAVADATKDYLEALKIICDKMSDAKNEEEANALVAEVSEAIAKLESSAKSEMDKNMALMGLIKEDGVGRVGIKLLGDCHITLAEADGALVGHFERPDPTQSEQKVDSLTADQIVDICKSVEVACQSVVDYNNTVVERNALTKEFENFVKLVDGMKSETPFAAAFFNGIHSGMQGSYKLQQALERPIIAGIQRSSSALLQVCKLSIAAHSEGAANAGLPAPANA